MTTRRCLAAPVFTVATLCAAGGAAAQDVVDRGTGDLGPNSASQRVVDPGNAVFSPEAALVDRFSGASASQLADLYHRGDVSRRYLYQAPGVAAMYNRSDYLTRDGVGLVGLNGTNAGHGQMVAVTPADIVYVLSPELLDGEAVRVVDEGPALGQVDHRVRPTPVGGSLPGTGVDGRVSTQVDGRYDPERPALVDVAAIEARMRGAQRDPRLVERSRRWKEEREQQERAEREARERAEREAAQGAGESGAGEAGTGETPVEADEPGASGASGASGAVDGGGE